MKSGKKCNICKSKLVKFELDHIKPVCLGGSNDDLNIQVLCKGCHMEKTTKEIETKLKSGVIKEEVVKKVNIYKTGTIFENVPISELMDIKYKNSIIIYAQTLHITDEGDEYVRNNITQELDDVILHYNYIPSKIKNQGSDVVQFVFNKNEQNITLVIDPNDPTMFTWKYIKMKCETLNIEFINQSFGGLMTQLKDRFYKTNGNQLL